MFCMTCTIPDLKTIRNKIVLGMKSLLLCMNDKSGKKMRRILPSKLRAALSAKKHSKAPVNFFNPSLVDTVIPSDDSLFKSQMNGSRKLSIPCFSITGRVAHETKSIALKVDLCIGGILPSVKSTIPSLCFFVWVP